MQKSLPDRCHIYILLRQRKIIWRINPMKTAKSKKTAETKKKIIIAIAVLSILSSLLLSGCGDKKTEETEPIAFPEFKAADFEGNEVSNDIFSESAVTAVTFWFTGCGACTAEMPQLETIRERVEEKDAKVIGICTDVSSLDGSLSIAKSLLEKNGATYQNIVLNSSDEVNEFVRSVRAYPTMMFVNRKGEIIGKSIVGAIMNEKQIDEVIERMDEIIEADED